MRSYILHLIAILSICLSSQGCGGDRSGSNAGSIGKVAVNFSFIRPDGTPARDGRVLELTTGQEQELVDGKVQFYLPPQTDLAIFAEIEGIEDTLLLGPAFEDTSFLIQISQSRKKSV